MRILQPSWLLLLLPLWVFFRTWKIPARMVRGLRIGSVFCLILALAGVMIPLPEYAGHVVVVVDRSRSMPPNSDEAAREIIRHLQQSRPEGNHLSVVGFGEKTGIEMMGAVGVFPGFQQVVGNDASNLKDALEKSLSLVPQGAPGRILLISDGRWTGEDPYPGGMRAANEAIPLDFRLLYRVAGDDLAILRIDTPETVTPGESFLFIVWVQSPTSQTVTFEWSRDETTLETGTHTIPAGVSRLVFRDRVTEVGNRRYRVTVNGERPDALPENNVGNHILACLGPKKVLALTDTPGSGLVKVLQADGLNVAVCRPDEMSWSIDHLTEYSAVLVENLSADRLGMHGMKLLAGWVKEAAGGLMMTGGKNAYGSGGYFRSPLEPVLPISMELRNEHRKLSMAIVVVLDRSGSMMMRTPEGVTKMEMANAASVQVLDLMSPYDELGVLAVDTSPHTVVELQKPVDKGGLRSKVLTIESQGGGIYVYEALLAAYEMLSKAQAQNRHIILFSDAADSENPGNYQELMDKGAKANITVSVIGLGTPADCDAALLKDIASRGAGRLFFTQDANELPRLFAQDTFMVSKSTFIDEPIGVESTPGMTALLGRSFAYDGTIGGYNLCYLRPEAYVGMIGRDEYKAPIVSAWNVGLGRALCYAGEVDGVFTGDIARWPSVREFFSSLTRWTAGNSDVLGWNTMLTQKIIDGMCVVELHLDPDRSGEPFTRLPIVTNLSGKPGQDLETRHFGMEWTSPDTLAARIPMKGEETMVNSLVLAKDRAQVLPPVCLVYSPEFQPEAPGKGAGFLEKLSRLTRGKERVDPTAIWKDLPPRHRLFDLTPWFLALVIFLLLLEVLERRTGALSRWRFRGREHVREQLRKVEMEEILETPRKPELAIPALKPKEEEMIPVTKSEENVAKRTLMGALQKAQDQARRRTEK
jgi:Mg-chelatase subunit ChlD